MNPDDEIGVDDDPRAVLAELLEEVVDSFGLDVEVRVDESEGTLTGRVEGDDLGLLIGRRGQTIDALQHLAQRIVFPGGGGQMRVVIEVDGYRERQAQALRTVALDAAEDALASGAPVELDPMPASERRIVHEFLRDREDVSTHSEGEEPERYLIVEPVDG